MEEVADVIKSMLLSTLLCSTLLVIIICVYARKPALWIHYLVTNNCISLSLPGSFPPSPLLLLLFCLLSFLFPCLAWLSILSIQSSLSLPIPSPICCGVRGYKGIKWGVDTSLARRRPNRSKTESTWLLALRTPMLPSFLIISPSLVYRPFLFFFDFTHILLFPMNQMCQVGIFSSLLEIKTATVGHMLTQIQTFSNIVARLV